MWNSASQPSHSRMFFLSSLRQHMQQPSQGEYGLHMVMSSFRKLQCQWHDRKHKRQLQERCSKNGASMQADEQ